MGKGKRVNKHPGKGRKRISTQVKPKNKDRLFGSSNLFFNMSQEYTFEVYKLEDLISQVGFMLEYGNNGPAVCAHCCCFAAGALRSGQVSNSHPTQVLCRTAAPDS